MKSDEQGTIGALVAAVGIWLAIMVIILVWMIFSQ